MIRLLILVSIVGAAILGVTVADLSHHKQEEAEHPEVKALRILNGAYPSAVSLETLSTLVGETPGTVALALAGNPTVTWTSGWNGCRWYKIKYHQ